MRRFELSLDRAAYRLLAVLTGLIAIVAIELWAFRPDRDRAMAQVPDTGLQRQQIVFEARRTNELLEQILSHLRTGSVKVKLESADKRKATEPSGSRPSSR